jgi:hypothetical protein
MEDVYKMEDDTQSDHAHTPSTMHSNCGLWIVKSVCQIQNPTTLTPFPFPPSHAMPSQPIPSQHKKSHLTVL